MTVAHAFYNRKYRVKYTQVFVYIQTQNEITKIQTKKVDFPFQYQEINDRKKQEQKQNNQKNDLNFKLCDEDALCYDFAHVQIEQNDIIKEDQVLSIVWEFQNQPFEVIGFPCKKESNQKFNFSILQAEKLKLFHLKCEKYIKKQKCYLTYNGKSHEGMSGGPIVINKKGVNYAIGLHQGCQGSFRRGILFGYKENAYQILKKINVPKETIKENLKQQYFLEIKMQNKEKELQDNQRKYLQYIAKVQKEKIQLQKQNLKLKKKLVQLQSNQLKKKNQNQSKKSPVKQNGTKTTPVKQKGIKTSKSPVKQKGTKTTPVKQKGIKTSKSPVKQKGTKTTPVKQKGIKTSKSPVKQKDTKTTPVKQKGIKTSKSPVKQKGTKTKPVKQKGIKTSKSPVKQKGTKTTPVKQKGIKTSKSPVKQKGTKTTPVKQKGIKTSKSPVKQKDTKTTPVKQKGIKTSKSPVKQKGTKTTPVKQKQQKSLKYSNKNEKQNQNIKETLKKIKNSQVFNIQNNNSLKNLCQKSNIEQQNQSQHSNFSILNQNTQILSLENNNNISIQLKQNQTNTQQQSLHTQRISKSKYGQYDISIDKVNWLRLHNRSIQLPDVKILIQGNWKHIHVLNLTKNNINDESFELLMKGKWPNLKQLWLTSNQISIIQPFALINISSLTKLKLQGNQLGKNSAQFLRQKIWTHLNFLSLSFKNQQFQQCWKIVAENGWKHFKNLKIFHVYEVNNLSVKVKQKLSQWWRQRSPYRQLKWFAKVGDNDPKGMGEKYPR